MALDLDRKPRTRRAKPFQPAAGRPFEGESVPSIEARTRGFVARLVAALVGSGVIVTGLYGLVSGNHAPLMHFWIVAGPIVGAMTAHYFGRRGNDLT